MLLNPTLIWLLIGSMLCAAELVLPTAFIALVMGIAAFLVAAVAPWLPVNWQIFLWMGLSVGFVWGSRRFIPRSKKSMNLDSTEAEVLAEILPGKAGRVIYEGNSWAARCEDDQLAIAPSQRVYVVRREGTTLIVVPENLLHP